MPKFLRKSDPTSTQIFNWSAAQAAKPGMIECDEKGTPTMSLALEPRARGKYISQMNKADLTRFVKEEYGLEVDQEMRVEDVRAFATGEKAAREEAVAKLIESLFGKAITRGESPDDDFR